MRDRNDDQYWEDFSEDDEPEIRTRARSRKPKPKRSTKTLLRGIVVRARGHHYDVRVLGEVADQAELTDTREPTDEVTVRMCEVRGRLLQERGRDTLVAVGDYVRIVPEGADRGKIEMVEDRHSVLSRQHPGSAIPAEDVILANPDQVLVVFAVADPEPHLRMLDRFLVIAEANELPVVICANKVDLTKQATAATQFEMYEKIGYQVIYTSVETGDGMDDLQQALIDRVTVLTGPSGVGKSSLLNHLQPELNVQIGDLREVLGKGRHTTRAAQLYELSFGTATFVADTPGIRELGLYEIDDLDLGFYFREFVPFIHECRYPNCTHDHEPACAVREAVESGQIARARYDSYLRLLHEEE